MRVNNPGQPEVSDLEQQLVRVDENIGRLQISVQDVSGVDELQSPQQLVEKQSGVTCWRVEGEDQPPSCSSHCQEKLHVYPAKFQYKDVSVGLSNLGPISFRDF